MVNFSQRSQHLGSLISSCYSKKRFPRFASIFIRGMFNKTGSKESHRMTEDGRHLWRSCCPASYLSRATQSQPHRSVSRQLFMKDAPVSLITLAALCWTLSSTSMSPLPWRAQNWTHHSRSAEQSRRTTSPDLLATLLMQPRISLALFAEHEPAVPCHSLGS